VGYKSPPLLINPLAMGVSSGKQNINSDIMPPDISPPLINTAVAHFEKCSFIPLMSHPG